MKIRHKRRLISILFIPYTILFIIALTLMTAAYIAKASKTIRENSFSSIENNLANMSDNFYQIYESLNTISLNVIYSNLIKERFASYVNYSIADTAADKNQQYANVQNTKVLYDLLYTMIGPKSPVDQIYLYGLERSCFGTGLDNLSSFDSVKNASWYDTLQTTDKYVFLDHDKRLEKYFSYEEGRYFLTMVSKYYNINNIPQGVIEVKKSIAPLHNTISSYNRFYDETLYIFQADGNLIYPLQYTDEAALCFSAITDSSLAASDFNESSMKITKDSYILYRQSLDGNFIFAALVSKHALRAPVYDYLFANLSVMLLILIAIVGISYFISKQISLPLNRIYNQISSFQLENTPLTDMNFPEIQTPIKELDTLYDALIEIQQNARNSMARELQLQTREMQSRILALQAQMNPHFLYNSLSVIQAMADENMTDEIYTMCQNISSILRYISSDQEQLVDLVNEVEHTQNYLECMKIRHGRDLSFEIRVPDSMNHFKIPKLCLQLVVENAIKFSTKKRPPWHINVAGRLFPEYWEIQVIDDGPGFTEEKLQELQEGIDEINRTGTLPNLEINGMGLMNIYIRFKMLYHEKHIFRLANTKPHGAIVTIGGKIT